MRWRAIAVVLLWATLVGWATTVLSDWTVETSFQVDLGLPATAGLLTLLPYALTASWGVRLVDEKHTSRWAIVAMVFALLAGAAFWGLMVWYGGGLTGSAVSSTSAVWPFVLSVASGFLLGIGSLAFLDVWPGTGVPAGPATEFEDDGVRSSAM